MGRTKDSRSITVNVVWLSGPGAGTVEVINGRLISPARFELARTAPARLAIRVSDAILAAGARPTMVTVRTKANPFTFFLRNVNADFPIYIPEYGVAVTAGDDRRTFAELAEAVRGRDLVGGMQRIEFEPEESCAAACAATRDMRCPTWLGIGRDVRFFRVHPQDPHGYWGAIETAYHSCLPDDDRLPKDRNRTGKIIFDVGPGSSCRVRLTRRLDDGSLPILHSVQQEDDVRYEVTAFATLETRPLSPEAVRGTDWRAAYALTNGNLCSKDDMDQLAGLLTEELYERDEELVCAVRVRAINGGRVPRYAWFRAPRWFRKPSDFDAATGALTFDGRAISVSRLNGRPMPQKEMALLLLPDESATVEMLVPHQPIDMKRASRLAKLDFDAHLSACRAFWRAKLSAKASIAVPEQAIDERIRAGLLHCDIVTLGKSDAGPLLATIGWYSPIGSESSPIIQFFDSMGWHRQAERCIQFFLDRQRPDGFMQNFGGYQLETGGVLWTMGEHFRYTRDRAWLRRVRGNIERACDYLLAWRERNKKPQFRGRGYGLAEGKVADPEDFFHSFMLNALAYVGLARSAEMLAEIDPPAGHRLAREAAAYRGDIRKAYRESVARSPVLPTGSGEWVPTAPPWAEYPGPLALYADGGEWFTHGAFGARDSLIGSLYLVICEVFDADEPEADFLKRFHHELFTVRNAGLSQPYYCRHDFIHAARGEVKPFLKTYYNQMASLQDRETYTFWEHYFHASQHKTHEEGWFLMQTRWMLWMERGATLSLFRAIPRAWLADGQQIRLDNVVSHFGPLTVSAESNLAVGQITSDITCRGKHRPKAVEVRLPHPDGLRPVAVTGGEYERERETVRIAPFPGRARLTLRF